MGDDEEGVLCVCFKEKCRERSQTVLCCEGKRGIDDRVTATRTVGSAIGKAADVSSAVAVTPAPEMLS